MFVPNGYTLVQHDRALLIVKDTHKERLLAQGIADPEKLIQSCRVQEPGRTGRGSMPAIPVQGAPGETMILRSYLRGGVLRFFNRDMYIGCDRPFKELCLTVAAASGGVPTLDILAAVAVNVTGPLYRGYLMSKELSSCCDLPRYLSDIVGVKSFFTEKRNLLKKTAEAVCLMHDRGFFHGDLNMKNILVDTAPPHSLYIIDWDKSRHAQRLLPAERRANILRFCRSMAKLARSGVPLTERDQAYFLSIYWHSRKYIRTDLFRLRMSVALRRVLWNLYGR
jgi:hypothetical protein